MKKKILVVDDEKAMLQLLDKILSDEGFSVSKAEDAENAFSRLKEVKPDLIILDVLLPEIGGFEICREIRSNPKTKNIPIIMLTSVGKTATKVHGLEQGADDYLTKPFDHKELVARVKALLRRSGFSEAPETALKSGNLTLYPERYVVTIGKTEIDLRPKELELLHMLMKNKDKVMHRNNIFESIWGIEYFGGTRTLDVHIRYLRKKLKQHGKKIVTVEGVGYKFSDKE